MEFGFGTLAAIKLDENRNRMTKLDSLRALLGMRLGKVCHSRNYYFMSRQRTADYGSASPGSDSDSGPISLTAHRPIK